MTLFGREHFEAFTAGMPHSFIVHQWGDASVAKVGTSGNSKIFAILSNWSAPTPAISFKCGEMSFTLLTELDGVRPAPYLARAKWVQAMPGSALGAEALADYIAQAHRLAFLSLPRKIRDRLDVLLPVA